MGQSKAYGKIKILLSLTQYTMIPCASAHIQFKRVKCRAFYSLYHVEFSIDNPTEINVDQGTLSGPVVSAKNGDDVTFHGICEDADEDVYYVRFDTDWLEWIDITAPASPKVQGDFISFSADYHDIGIYPYTL